MHEYTVKKIETGFAIQGSWDKDFQYRKEWAFVDWSSVIDWMKSNEPVFPIKEEIATAA